MNHSTMNIDEMEKGAGKKYKERMELKNGDPTLLKCIKLTIVLPLGAFFFCVIITLIKDFQQATYTHCKVPNFLPSISSCIGDFIPQKYIWKTSISLHTTPRLFFLFLWRESFKEKFKDSLPYKSLFTFTNVLELVEICSLLLLSIVSSNDAYEWHEKSFITFIITSQFNMLITVLLFIHQQHHQNFDLSMQRSLKLKKAIWVLNTLSTLCSLAFFIIHNKMCLPYAYSFFALSEYSLVLSNLAFHATRYYDMSQVNVSFVERKQ